MLTIRVSTDRYEAFRCGLRQVDVYMEPVQRGEIVRYVEHEDDQDTGRFVDCRVTSMEQIPGGGTAASLELRGNRSVAA
jgi:hypothetical protein